MEGKMAQKKVYVAEGPEAVRDQVIYSEGRLLYDEDAKDLAPPFTKLANDFDSITLGLWACWRAETLAQSQVDSVNYRMDRRVEKHAKALRFVTDNTPQGQATYNRYYEKLPPSRVIALSLEPEVKVVRDWLTALQSEKAPELQAFATGFVQDVSDGEAALRYRDESASSRRNYWTQVIATKVDELNKVRKETFGELSKRAASLNKEDGWAESFFKKQKKNAKEEPVERWRQALFSVLNAFELETPDAVLEVIEGSKEADKLQRWHKALTNGASLVEVFGDIAKEE
jgi:hypothetical protein